jgi:chromosome segregation ATPase
MSKERRDQDDSSIQISDRHQRDRNKIAAKLELLDAQIADAEQAVRTIAEEREDLGARRARLDETMDAALRAWDEKSVSYRDLAAGRRVLRQRRDDARSRAIREYGPVERTSNGNRWRYRD